MSYIKLTRAGISVADVTILTLAAVSTGQVLTLSITGASVHSERALVNVLTGPSLTRYRHLIPLVTRTSVRTHRVRALVIRKQ